MDKNVKFSRYVVESKAIVEKKYSNVVTNYYKTCSIYIYQYTHENLFKFKKTNKNRCSQFKNVLEETARSLLVLVLMPSLFQSRRSNRPQIPGVEKMPDLNIFPFQ